MGFPRRFVPTVTDHAVVRWMERVLDVDVDAIREQILEQGRDSWIAQGAVSVQIPELKVTLVAKDGTVITVKSRGKRVKL